MAGLAVRRATMTETKRPLHDPNTDETLPLGVSVELVMPRAPKTRAPSAMRPTTSIVAPPSVPAPPGPIVEAAQKLMRELADTNLDVALGRVGRERSFGIDAALSARDTAVRELAILLGPRDPDAIRLREAYNQLDARVRAQAEHRRDTRAPPRPASGPGPTPQPEARAPTPTITAAAARAAKSTVPAGRSALERVFLGATLVAAIASVGGLLLARRAELRPRPRPTFTAEPLRCVGETVVGDALECTLDAATLSALSADDRRARLEATLAREDATREAQVLVVRDTRDGRLLALVAGPAGHPPSPPLEPPSSRR
jgi:hypothetical protein